MVNQIIDALIKALRTKFEEDKYRIYTDNVEQDLVKPCFFIFNIELEQERKLNDRHEQIHSFTIDYMPESISEPNVECNDIIPDLLECLEYIELNDGLLQTFNIKCKTIDGVLHCFFEYDVTMTKIKEQTMMLEQKTKGAVKNG